MAMNQQETFNWMTEELERLREEVRRVDGLLKIRKRRAPRSSVRSIAQSINF